MEARFKVVAGTDTNMVFRVGPDDTVRVGRGGAADIVLKEPRISRLHCQFTNNGKTVVVNDLQSTNGTFLNEKRVKSAPLEDGDEIRIGRTVIAVNISGAEEKPAKGQEGPDSVMGTFHEWMTEEDVFTRRAGREEEAEGEEGAGVAVEKAGKKGKGKPLRLVSGAVVGGCRLVEEIRSKDNLVVFSATQLSIGRSVSLKILANSATAAEEEVERFLGSARTTGKLNHPSIEDIHDSGYDGGYYYIIAELIRGKNIVEMTRPGGERKPLPITLAIEVAVRAAEALQYAHSHKIMHGNIHPERIMITIKKGEQDRGGVPMLSRLKLMDFGAGGYLLGGDSDRKRTEGRETILVHNYRAPEQLRRNTSVDQRADIYSLGGVLYRMLTARPPFAKARTAKTLVAAIRKEAPEPLHKLNPTVPRAVSRLVLTAMAKNPDDRYETADELLEALNELTALEG